MTSLTKPAAVKSDFLYDQSTHAVVRSDSLGSLDWLALDRVGGQKVTLASIVDIGRFTNGSSTGTLALSPTSCSGAGCCGKSTRSSAATRFACCAYSIEVVAPTSAIDRYSRQGLQIGRAHV